MTINTDQWRAYQPANAFDYEGDQLQQHWSRLHLCDAEPFPSVEFVNQWLSHSAAIKDSIKLDDKSPENLSAQLQQAWRYFHYGEFAKAVKLGESLGLLGAHVTNMTLTMYANHLEPDAKRQQLLLKEVARRCHQTAQQMPGYTNHIYFEGCAWGLYSQSISLLKAATEGIATKFSGALEASLEINPNHVLANLGFAIFHAEVVDTVGSMVAKVTYGASKGASESYLKKALNLGGELPVVQGEAAKTQLLLKGRKGKKQAQEFIDRALAVSPMDAMEELDQKAIEAIRL